jgi:hypothetical protein
MFRNNSDIQNAPLKQGGLLDLNSPKALAQVRAYAEFGRCGMRKLPGERSPVSQRSAISAPCGAFREQGGPERDASRRKRRQRSRHDRGGCGDVALDQETLALSATKLQAK